MKVDVLGAVIARLLVGPVFFNETAFLPTDTEARVRFPALPDFLRSSGSGTGSTQTRDHNCGAT
jgi:hypothetical protein